jgi:hypothetical protein
VGCPGRLPAHDRRRAGRHLKVLFALAHSLTAGIVTAAAFIAYQQIENHVLNPMVMSHTVKANPLLVLLSVLVGASIGSWLDGFFGAFVAALHFHPSRGRHSDNRPRTVARCRGAGSNGRRAASRPGRYPRAPRFLSASLSTRALRGSRAPDTVIGNGP